MQKHSYFVACLLLLAHLFSIARADGELDPRFAPQILNAGLETAQPNVVAVQADGKIVVGGIFRNVNGSPRAGLARLTADGKLDADFDFSAATISTNPYDSGVIGLLLQPDGRMLVLGAFSDLPGRTSLIRLLPDGRRDPGFQRYEGGRAMALLPDDKIVVANINGVMRLNSNGSPDRALFTPGLGSPSGGNISVAAQPDGKVLIGGAIFNPIGSSIRFFLRVNSDGSSDSSFTSPDIFISPFASAPAKMLPLNDGRIIVTAPGIGPVRLFADGRIDPSFKPEVTNIYDAVRQPDGRLVLAGAFEQVAGALRRNLARVNTDGSLDSSFDPGLGPNERVTSLALQLDGRVLALGAFTKVNNEVRMRFARFESSGRLDGGFNVRLANLGAIRTMRVAPDGKLVIAGTFDFIDGIERARLARLNADGTLDTGFAPPKDFSGDVFKLAVQPDGKVIGMTQDSGRLQLRRWRIDGSPDASFKGPAFNGGSLDDLIVVQNDGRILMIAPTTEGVSTNLLRLNSDGSRDMSFVPPAGLPIVSGLQRLPDGGILLTLLTLFADVNGQGRLTVARLSPDGLQESLHTTIFPNQMFLTHIVPAPDGKLSIGGNGFAPDGTRQSFVVRLNRDGTFDAGFKTAWLGRYKFDYSDISAIGSLAVQADGKALVGFAGSRGLVRLNQDGSVDGSLDFRVYSTTSDAHDSINVLATQPDGQCLIAGQFIEVGAPPGTVRFSMARVRLGATSNIAVTSGASFLAPVASESIASIFGVGLADAVTAATTLPLPTTLAGVTVRMTDQAGREHLAPLFFVSPTQINFLVPSAAAIGPATLRIELRGSLQATGTLALSPVAPGLFTFNANGRGVPAGYALRLRNGSLTREAIHQPAADGRWEPRPIDPGPAGDQVFLVLFGTGLRGRSALSNMTALIGGIPVEILYAGAQSDFAGLDQVNLLIPRNLAGFGAVDLVLIVDGQLSRTVQLIMK